MKVHFQTRQGKRGCPQCGTCLADLLTESEVEACGTGDELSSLTMRHYTFGWYVGVAWRTGPAFCRACVAEVFAGPEWTALLRAAGTDPARYAPVMRDKCGTLPKWLETAFWKAARLAVSGPAAVVK